jgi:hypothetical protein
MAECYGAKPTGNFRCILFTAFLALAYWFLPRKNKGVMVMALAVLCMALMVFYDWYFECKPAGIAVRLLFPALVGLGYWFLPQKNKWILLALLFFPYLVLAWYDHLHRCRRTMRPTYLSLFYAWAKPRESRQIQQYKNWCPKIKRQVMIVDIVILILVLVAAPFYIMWKPKRPKTW